MNQLKRTSPIALALVALVAVSAVAWALRTPLRDLGREALKPSLPAAVGYQEARQETVPDPAPPKTAPTVTSTAAAPPSVRPPTSVNLAVPFLSQAPKQNWDLPYQEACEEASSIMVDAYYKGQRAKFSPDAGEKAILDLVAYENAFLGFYKDTSALQTAEVIRTFFHANVRVSEVHSAADIRAELAKGRPVIVPASGKALGNPNFRNGGPPYHMLVVKGYFADGRWITNDPGTRLGADYIYQEDVLMKALHDWNEGDVLRGKAMMIVVLPYPKS